MISDIDLQRLNFAYGTLAASTRHRPQRAAFKLLALISIGISVEDFEAWADQRMWFDALPALSPEAQKALDAGLESARRDIASGRPLTPRGDFSQFAVEDVDPTVCPHCGASGNRGHLS
jgi:hypothetical protein